MDWSWANTIEQALRGSGVPLWGWLAFLLVLVTVLTIVLRADKTVANVALALVSLAAVAGFVFATHPGGDASSNRFGASASEQEQGAGAVPVTTAPSHPALACLDGLAGETVERACEARLFGAPDVTAAAVSSVAARLNQLRAVAEGRSLMTPDLFALRVALERDRFGLVAHVLKQRDGCTPQMCDAFRVFVKRDAIVANMESGTYDKLVERYAQAWATPGAASAGLASPSTAPAANPQSVGASGVPTSANFPSSASIPAVSIMNNEPGTSPDGAEKAEPPAPARTAIPKPKPAKPAKPATAAAPRPRNAAAPIQIAPQGGTGAAADE